MIIADLLLATANFLSDTQLKRRAAWEGFLSSFNLIHFINLYQFDDKEILDQAIQHLDDNFQTDSQKDSYDYCYIHFLNGDYDLVWNICQQDKKSLGWTYSEKGRLFPLFVMLLGGQTVMPCTIKMMENSFANKECLENFLKIYASECRVLQETDYLKYYDWCVREMDNRVNAIVKGQHRKSYYKASALIVSIAEVIRSKDDVSGAIELIRSYKEKYPRHSAFRQCLREDVEISGFGRLF
jgi:hypothetical protein